MQLLVISHHIADASFRQRIGIHLDLFGESGITADVFELPKGFFSRLALYRRAEQYDAVLLHRKRLNALDMSILQRYARAIIYDFDDAIMYSSKNPDVVKRRLLWDFERTVRHSDCVIAGNRYLAAHAQKLNSRVHVLPTGLDVGKFDRQPQSRQDKKIRIVWIGSKSTLPYLKTLIPAMEAVGKTCPDAVLRIICDDFFELENMPVEQCIWTENTEAADLLSCDIAVAPLPDNPFTRGKCGFKILQYYAAGLPVVASPVGVNAEYVQQENTGYHAGTTDQWINALSILIHNAPLRKQLGQRGKQWVLQYDRHVIGRSLMEIIHQTVRQEI